MRTPSWIKGDRGNKHIHLVMAAVWTLFIPVWWLTDLRYSVALVNGMSLYTIIIGHIGNGQSAKAAEVAEEAT